MVNAPTAATLDVGALAPAEVEAAVALWDEAGLLRPWNDPRADIARALRSPCATVLAGRRDGAFVAVVMVGWDGHRGWIYYLAVAADERRRGFGARMLRAAEAWLAERGAPKLNLLVRAENAAVVGFYEAMGYRRGDVLMMQRALG
jgi:ribosomal protein S18 acetylase RimI-like enzyme